MNLLIYTDTSTSTYIHTCKQTPPHTQILIQTQLQLLQVRTFSLTATSEVSSNSSLVPSLPLIKLPGNTLASSELGISVPLPLVLPFSSSEDDSSPQTPLFPLPLPLPLLFSLSAFSLFLLASQFRPPWSSSWKE